MALLSTEDSNDSQKRMRAVHPTLAYPFFSLIRPLLLRLSERHKHVLFHVRVTNHATETEELLFLRVLPKGGRICEGLLYQKF